MDNPPVPFFWNIFWPMGTVELVAVMCNLTGIKHRKRCCVWFKPHIVVALAKHISTKPFKILDRFLTVLHVHRNISEMNKNVIGIDYVVVTFEEFVIHLPD